MIKGIWHTPPEQPDPFKSWNVLVVYEANDRKEMMYSTQFIHATDGMYVNRWCYLDDLLALETDLERTRKALEIAVDALEKIDKTRSVANHKIGTQDKTLNSGIAFCWATPDEIHNAIAEITALEQKD